MTVSKEKIKQYAIRLGDDSVVLGHRLSEWCSYGPFLEEDLALTNVALDFIGRARMFYGYAAELADDGSRQAGFDQELALVAVRDTPQLAADVATDDVLIEVALCGRVADADLRRGCLVATHSARARTSAVTRAGTGAVTNLSVATKTDGSHAGTTTARANT